MEPIMKRLLAILFCLAFLALASNGLAQSGQAKKFAVLPFQIHGPSDYQYLSNGIQTMLKSRLYWEEHVLPVDEAAIKTSSAEITSQAQAKQTLQELQAEYLFWGSVTILSEQASIDLNILEQGKPVKTRSWQSSLGDLIPSMENQAKRVSKQIFDRPVQLAGAAAGAATAQAQQQEQQQAQQAQQPERQQPRTTVSEKPSSQFIQQSERKSGYIEKESRQPSYFEKQSSRGEPGRWRSRRFSFESRGLRVGDGDGDGSKEIFILTKDTVYACTKRQGKLEMLGEHSVSRRLECLNLNLIDLDGDADMELVVSAVQDEEDMHSFILDYRNGQLQILQEGIVNFLNVVKQPPSYEPVLLGQSYNPSRLFHGSVHTLTLKQGGLKATDTVQLPENVNVSNLAYLPVGNGYKIVAVDIFSKLKVFTPGGEVQYASNEKYAASTVKLKENPNLPGVEDVYETQKFHYIPSRLLPGDFNKDGQYELMVNRNISIAADLLPRFRHYPKGEIHSLYWDGMGLSLDWKTKTIQGTVVDYGIADMDNNGSRELYVSVNTYPGLSNLKEVKTIIMAYSIKPIFNQQESASKMNR
jgi:hypothetical protein